MKCFFLLLRNKRAITRAISDMLIKMIILALCVKIESFYMLSVKCADFY